MIVRCPKCMFGNHDTETVCHKCKTALPPVRVEDFVGQAKIELGRARRTLGDCIMITPPRNIIAHHRLYDACQAIGAVCDEIDLIRSLPNAEGQPSAERR